MYQGMLQEALQKIFLPSFARSDDVNALMDHIRADLPNITFYSHELPPPEVRNLVDMLMIIVHVNGVGIRQTLVDMGSTLNVETRVIAKKDILKHLFAKFDLSGRLAKWVIVLSDFDLQFITQKSIKGQLIASQLVDAPSSKYFPTLDLFPDENVLIIDQDSVWDMYFDGSRCQTGSGPGVVFVSPEGKKIPLSFYLEFHCINNITEYKAVILGLRVVITMGVKNIHIHGDSELIVNQVTSAYHVKQLKLSQYMDLVLTILKHFATYTINSISRRENHDVDAMVSIASLVGPDFG
ncbi:uncharacterized protein LOC131079089 [Cryptomeria japonica]|uniref:uncharacterized protein LOC131079089 n=1 Tax=Cryptomeria japonica TaxID=3369 RepID=UPI0027DA6054|nr:uncharacterized protein LOC131079089 [Cryptomeria japonica]